MRFYIPLLLLATLLVSCEDDLDEEVVTLEKQWDVQLLSETNVTAGGIIFNPILVVYFS